LKAYLKIGSPDEDEELILWKLKEISEKKVHGKRVLPERGSIQ
jgi:hypothetical protein